MDLICVFGVLEGVACISFDVNESAVMVEGLSCPNIDTICLELGKDE